MDLNRIVALSLRLGVLASAFLSILGIILWGGNGFPQNLNLAFTNLGSILGAVIHADPVGIVYLAVIILVATPIVRIIFSSIYFILDKDKQFTIITLTVLAMMLLTLFVLPR